MPTQLIARPPMSQTLQYLDSDTVLPSLFLATRTDSLDLLQNVLYK